MGVFVKTFAELNRGDAQEAGGKAANLSELTHGGFRVPPGFCVTSPSLEHLIQVNGLQAGIDAIAATFDYDDYEGVEARTAEIRGMIEAAPVPVDLEVEIRGAVGALTADDPALLVAVRSSVAVKGTAISSFPGMMDTYHYLQGEDEILAHIRLCWASVWTARAVYSRSSKSIDHNLALIAPTVQKMVHSEVAGVLFTANPISGSRDEMVVESNWGLGESVVSGKSMNDFYILDKASGQPKVAKVARKTIMFDLDRETGKGRLELPVPSAKSEMPTLGEAELAQLSDTGRRIEQLFGFPQDVEWAFEGGELFILQSRNIKNLQAQG